MPTDPPSPGAPPAFPPAQVVFVLVCLTGWTIMELELLGARLLIPYFGSSIYVVMGSVIGVFLLSLAAGYLIGGSLSNVRAAPRLLAAAVALAALWLCLLPLFAGKTCEALLDLDETLGSLVASFLLFAVPTTLLGTVSPTAIRLLTRRPENAGFCAGLVLGLSTAAGFAGTLVTAFYLVRLSIARTIIISGAVLLGGSLLLFLASPRADAPP